MTKFTGTWARVFWLVPTSPNLMRALVNVSVAFLGMNSMPRNVKAWAPGLVLTMGALLPGVSSLAMSDDCWGETRIPAGREAIADDSMMMGAEPTGNALLGRRNPLADETHATPASMMIR